MADATFLWTPGIRVSARTLQGAEGAELRGVVQPQ